MSLLNLNYFEIFGIEAQITIDIEHLNKKYLTLQSEFHPDKFVNASNPVSYTHLTLPTSHLL